jgi:photosystem II stability/assembly factor-like uncharacterized protein
MQCGAGTVSVRSSLHLTALLIERQPDYPIIIPMKKLISLFALVLFCLIAFSLNVPALATRQKVELTYHTYLPAVSKTISPTWLGPDGGKIMTLVIDPIHSDTLYAGTWGSGVFKATTAGQNWYPINAGLESQYIWTLAINPLQPEILYAGTYRGKLYKSLNSGLSWFLSSTGIQEQAIIYAIAINPLEPSTLYAATRGLSNNGEAPWSGVVYRSFDAGASWQVSLKDVPIPWQQDWAYALAIHPASPNILFAATHEYGIYRSDDSGYNWYTVNGGLSDFTTRDIVVDPRHSPFYAYSGFWHRSGVQKSTDGITWAPTIGILNGVKIFRITIDRNQADTLYLATQSSEGIIKTTNGGDSWSPSGLTNQGIWQVAVHPQNSQVLYSGTDDDGLYKSTDAGASWAHAQKGLTAISATGTVTLLGDPQTLYVSTLGAGVFKTNDDGDTWSKYIVNLPDRLIHALVQHPTNADLVYALSDTAGLYYTNIRSASGWTISSPGLPFTNTLDTASEQRFLWDNLPFLDADVNDLSPRLDQTQATLYKPLLAMAFAPSNPNIVYLGTGGAGVYKSTNGAGFWSPAGLNNSTIHSLAVSPANPNFVYAAVDLPGGVQVSRDGGVSWEDFGLNGMVVNELAFSSSTNKTLYAGTDNGLYLWVNESGWTLRGLEGQNVTAVKAHPSIPNTIYAGTENGMYIYYETSQDWGTGPATLSGHTIQAIDFDLNYLNQGYFSTPDLGILLALIK